MAQRIAFVHPAPWLPESGGERNMVAIHAAMHARGLEVHGICLPGPLRDHLCEQKLRAESFPWWRARPAGRAAYAQAAGALYRLILSQPAAPASHVAQALEQCAALCEPDPQRQRMPHHHSPVDEADGLWHADEPLPVGGTMERMLPLDALRLRAAIAALQPRCVFADHPWDCLALMVATGGSGVQPVWYPQLSEADPLVDPLLAVYRPRIVTCGDGVKACRFADAADVTSIPNGIDTSLFSPVAAGSPRPPLFVHAGARDKVLVTVGNLVARKGGRQLVAACRLMQLSGEPFHLYFLGNGPDAFRRTLQREVHEAGLDARVHFAGAIDNIPQVLPHADIFVLPSLAEGLPLSLCEAMACGIPCVASDLAGCREVAGSRGALLVLPDAPAALASALLRLCRSDTLRRQLAQRGRARVLAHFERGTMMDRFEAFFCAL